LLRVFADASLTFIGVIRRDPLSRGVDDIDGGNCSGGLNDEIAVGADEAEIIGELNGAGDIAKDEEIENSSAKLDF
jgi:hypothetical protein